MSQKSIPVEATGGPLAVVIDGANVHDSQLPEATIDAIVSERPRGGGCATESVPGQGVWHSFRCGYG